jgi:hypothetical protein
MCDFHLIRGQGWQAIQNSCAGIRIKIQFGHVINALFEKAAAWYFNDCCERRE